jgi:hypothetical protein
MALEAARAIGLSEMLVMVLTRASESALVLEDHDRARGALIEALRLLLEVGGRGWVAASLELAAVVRGATGGISVATARVLGAAQAVRDVTGESFRFPYHEVLLKRLVEDAEAALGAEEFKRERDQGSRLATEEAVALALTQVGLQDREDLRG